MKCLFVSARSCTVLLDEQGDYYAKMPRTLKLNGEALPEENRSVASLYGLWPDTDYTLESWLNGEKEAEITFRTEIEVVSLNVKRFGAKGDKAHAFEQSVYRRSVRPGSAGNQSPRRF